MVKIKGTDGKEIKPQPKKSADASCTTQQFVEKSDKKDFYQTEDGRPCYHQSTLKHYLRCPRSFKIAHTEKAEIGANTRRIMGYGLLMEALIFGTKVGKGGKTIEDLKAGMKKPTIDSLQSIAEGVKDREIFDMAKGRAFVTAIWDTPDYRLEGEYDYIGPMKVKNWKGELEIDEEEVIGDCKLTGSIEWVWDAMEMKEDYLQAIQYCYMHYMNTGRLVPFVYIIIENKYDKPIVKARKIVITERDFYQWYLPFIQKVHEDEGYVAEGTERACLGYEKGQKSRMGRCWFFKYCDIGKYLIEKTDVVEFTDLQTNNYI